MDDIVLPGMAYVKILRSPMAHARIISISTARAAAAPGVIGVYTGADFAEVNALPYAWQAAGVTNHTNTPRVLAVDEVHWVRSNRSGRS
jgi:carbon-monoxide dehydrogenase large subunit